MPILLNSEGWERASPAEIWADSGTKWALWEKYVAYPHEQGPSHGPGETSDPDRRELGNDQEFRFAAKATRNMTEKEAAVVGADARLLTSTVRAKLLYQMPANDVEFIPNPVPNDHNVTARGRMKTGVGGDQELIWGFVIRVHDQEISLAAQSQRIDNSGDGGTYRVSIERARGWAFQPEVQRAAGHGVNAREQRHAAIPMLINAVSMAVLQIYEAATAPEGPEVGPEDDGDNDGEDAKLKESVEKLYHDEQFLAMSTKDVYDVFSSDRVVDSMEENEAGGVTFVFTKGREPTPLMRDMISQFESALEPRLAEAALQFSNEGTPDHAHASLLSIKSLAEKFQAAYHAKPFDEDEVRERRRACFFNFWPMWVLDTKENKREEGDEYGHQDLDQQGYDSTGAEERKVDEYGNFDYGDNDSVDDSVVAPAPRTGLLALTAGPAHTSAGAPAAAPGPLQGTLLGLRPPGEAGKKARHTLAPARLGAPRKRRRLKK